MNVGDVIRKPEARLMFRCPQGHDYTTQLFDWSMDDEGGVHGCAGSDADNCPTCDEKPELVGVQLGTEVM